MTREEQIKKAAHDFSWGWCDDKAHPLNDGFIEGAKWADSHPQWIPVEEELPPKGMEVLAWGITKPVEKGKLSFCDVFYSWRMDHKPLFYDEVDENGFCLYSLGSRSDHRGFKITHWMPLPEAPRKED